MRIDPCPLTVKSCHMAEMMPQVGKVQPYHAFKYETVVVHTTVIHLGLSLLCSNEIIKIIITMS